MPLIHIEATKVSKEQKAQLIEEITATAARILSVDASAFIVLVKENSTDDWGVGGKVLTGLMQK